MPVLRSRMLRPRVCHPPSLPASLPFLFPFCLAGAQRFCPLSPHLSLSLALSIRSCMPTGMCLCDGDREGATCGAQLCQIDECAGVDTCHDPAYGSSSQECAGQGQCLNGHCSCPANGVCAVGDSCHTTMFADSSDCTSFAACVNSTSSSRNVPGLDVLFFNDFAQTQLVSFLFKIIQAQERH